jgi:hypothetical protein
MKEYRNEEGQLHRLDGPAVENSNGDKFWYQNGKLHRVDGPAEEILNVYKAWYQYGKLHREDGPAVELSNGTKKWYINNVLHRLDGPAIEYDDGTVEYSINGNYYLYEEFLQLTSFPKEQYSTNEANITYIRLEDNIGLRISLYNEFWVDGTYKIIQDETLDQLVKGIDKDNPIINPLHDYVLENLTSLNV